MPKQCTIHVAIVWYHFGLARSFKSPEICEKHTNIYTYMTRAHFPSIVGLRLRAFGAQPPSESYERHFLYLFALCKTSQEAIIHHYLHIPTP